MKALLLLAILVPLAPGIAAADAPIPCEPLTSWPDCPVGVTVNRGCSGEPLTTVCVYV